MRLGNGGFKVGVFVEFVPFKTAEQVDFEFVGKFEILTDRFGAVRTDRLGTVAVGVSLNGFDRKDSFAVVVFVSA